MEENEEIKKDREALNEYLKKDNYDAFKEFSRVFAEKAGMKYPDYVAKLAADESFMIKYTPAKINVNREKGVIELPKSMFDKKNPEYHRMKLKIFDTLFYYEVLSMVRGIDNKEKITKKEVLEWYNHTDRHLKEHDEAKKFLKNLGENIKTNWLAVGLASKIKNELVRKYWWQMGFIGIKRRIKLYKSDSWIKKFKEEHKEIFKDGKTT